MGDYRVRKFDDEHQRLTRTIAQTHEALLAEHDRLGALKLIEQLIKETCFHFIHEEDVMEAAHYSDLKSHEAEHTALLARAENLRRQIAKGSVSSLVFPCFLRDWLVPHMQDYDRKYSATLRRLDQH